MPAHGKYGLTSLVRYNKAEDEWSMRCADCAAADRACWWPIGIEFWDPRSLLRCRACETAKRRRQDRERRGRIPQAERDREYRRKNRAVLNMKRRHRRALAKEAALADIR